MDYDDFILEAKRKAKREAEKEAEAQAERDILERAREHVAAVEARRTKIEHDRWGTSKRALQTAEARARTLVELATMAVARFRKEHELALQRQGHRRFAVYEAVPVNLLNNPGKFLSGIKGEAKLVGHLCIEGLKLQRKQEGGYEVVWQGTRVIANQEIYQRRRERGFDQVVSEVICFSASRYENPKALGSVIEEIFIPLIAVELITAGQSSTIESIRKVAELQARVVENSALEIKWRCTYDSGLLPHYSGLMEFEDTSTFLSEETSGKYAQVRNPYYREMIIQRMRDEAQGSLDIWIHNTQIPHHPAGQN